MSKTIAVSSKAITKLTTPQLLKGSLYLTWGASLLLLIATISGVQWQRQAIKTIGKESTPSIIAAQHIKAGLADMDANAANELIAQPGQNPQSVKDYENRRQEVAKALVSAAENITYGDAERIPIQTLQLGLGEYIAKIQQARDFHTREDAAAILVAYRTSAEVLDKTLLPAADALDRANLEVLNRTYAAKNFASRGYLVFVVVSGLALIAVLVAIQLFLSQRMRRTFNPMLLAATAIALVFLGYTTRAFLSGNHQLKVVKEDAFDSIHALWQARAYAYSANADESRYLLDTALAPTHEQAFFHKVGKVATLPAGQTFETVTALSAQGKKVEGFTGYLADELNNITFNGEQEAAISTLSNFGIYLAIDKQIRQLEQSGKHQAAIALCTGNNKGDSNRALKQFDASLDQTLKINQQAFDEAVEQGFKDLDGFEIITPVSLVVIALLTLFGLLPRLKEYSV